MLAFERLTATATYPGAERTQALAGRPAAVSVERLSKSFRLPQQQYSTLKERALHPLRARTYEALRALEEVTFDVRAGEFFGIVGRNGSGKSTLLKCLAGIYDIDAGDVTLEGRLSPFIELGVGFNPDLTARDNVLVNAIMLGLSRKEARARFDDIIAFAELEEFVDLKLKNYSSGMSVRLGFSVAVQVDADIVLVDEVLAVGDASFQQKCFDEFGRMKDEGRTILFVTHDMATVERFCDRAMLLERGRVVDIGEPGPIGRKYQELNFGQIPEAPGSDGDQARGPIEITSAWFEDGRGERVVALAQGEECRACVEVTFHEPLEDPVFTLALRNDVRHTIFVASTSFSEGATGSFTSGESVLIRFRFENWLAPSRYTLTPLVARQEALGQPVDRREDLASLIVHGTYRSGGVVDLPHELEIERS